VVDIYCPYSRPSKNAAAILEMNGHTLTAAPRVDSWPEFTATVGRESAVYFCANELPGNLPASRVDYLGVRWALELRMNRLAGFCGALLIGGVDYPDAILGCPYGEIFRVPGTYYIDLVAPAPIGALKALSREEWCDARRALRELRPADLQERLGAIHHGLKNWAAGVLESGRKSLEQHHDDMEMIAEIRASLLARDLGTELCVYFDDLQDELRLSKREELLRLNRWEWPEGTDRSRVTLRLQANSSAEDMSGFLAAARQAAQRLDETFVEVRRQLDSLR
jgi:hypothetical protein